MKKTKNSKKRESNKPKTIVTSSNSSEWQGKVSSNNNSHNVQVSSLSSLTKVFQMT